MICDALPLEAAADRIKSHGNILPPVITAIDDWAAVRNLSHDGSEAGRLVAVVNVVDPDPWRQSLRSALASKDWTAVHGLSKSPEFGRQPAAMLYVLGAALSGTPFEIDVLRQAQSIYPGDFWINHRLGTSLIWPRAPERVREGIGYLHASVAIRPESSHARRNLGNGYIFLQRYDDAEFCFRKSVELDPKSATAHSSLGVFLGGRGKLDASIACSRTAIELDPKCTQAYTCLGMGLMAQGKLDESIACYSSALELDPRSALVHRNLGDALTAQGKLDEAIAEYRQANEIDPNDAGAHINLGVVLQAKGQIDEAIAEHRRAIELDPKHAVAHINLGVVLQAKGQIDEAIAEFLQAIELDPKHAVAHNNLGLALQTRDKVDDAIAEFRKAIEIDPKLALAHNNLNVALSLVKLPAYLMGEFQPGDNAERMGLAGVCYKKKLYQTAVGLYVTAFAADDKLMEDRQTQHAYNAACNAALATAGESEDPIPLDDTGRTRLRQQTLDWLTAELHAWTKLLDSDPTKVGFIAQTLHYWQRDADLASLREADALVELPPDEEKVFKQLWADVRLLLKRAETPAPPVTQP